MKGAEWTTWGILVAAASLELAGDLALKAWAETNRRAWFAVGLMVYCGALTLFALLLRRAQLAVIFGLWAGIAAALLALLGWLMFNEPLSLRRLAGLTLVVGGIVLLEM